jgi:hexosaminidase
MLFLLPMGAVSVKTRSTRRIGSLLFLGCLLVLALPLTAQTEPPLPVMPLPAHAVSGYGEFIIDGSFGIAFKGYTEPRLTRARERFLKILSNETGIPLWREAQFNQPRFVVNTRGPGDAVQKLGEDESYQLEVTASQVRLTAAEPLGVLHGLQTFLQLVTITPQGFSVPAVTINDSPRFPWRGLMIDVSRHFIPVPVIERNLDGMEAVKLNVFHWHLSDDQGFRVESKRFPLLQEKGSSGLYYTQKQIREVVQYARDRGIRVVPEFDMPCHTTSWFVGYPQLASGPGPYHVARHMGIHDAAMDPTKASVYVFLNSFIQEMTGLFPDAYFHIGGDECNGKEWENNAKIQAFMRTHHMANNAALQAYFTARVQKLVAKNHRVMEGWDEVLQPGTPKDVVIQSWRGQASLAQAARQGNRGLLSTGYYIDLNQSAAQHYLVDPLGGDAATLTQKQKALILGGEAAMWSEFVDPGNMDSRIWPRTAAIAERFWSPQQATDVDSMYRRLAWVGDKLEFYGINPKATTNEMLQRMSGKSDPARLKVLAAVVQPPPGYARKARGDYDTFTPLNRLVDAVPPESETGREFSNLVNRIVAGRASNADWVQARNWLVLWRDNDAQLVPSLQGSAITQELVPLSQTLREIAILGLQALDGLKDHGTINSAAMDNDLALLKSAEQPHAALINTIAPSVELLLKATKKE